MAAATEDHDVVRLFIASTGPYQVAMDARYILKVNEVASSSADCDPSRSLWLGTALGLTGSAPKNSRGLTLDMQPRQYLLADAVLGLQNASASQLARLPALMASSHAPLWLLGLALLQGRHLLLIDPVRLLGAR